MDDDTKKRLAEFSARFKQQTKERAAAKEALKQLKAETAERKALNSKFHIKHAPLPAGAGSSPSEQDGRIAYLAKQADEANWQNLSVLVTGQWQVCQCCGHEAIATAGYYFRQQHKTIPSGKRLKEISVIPEGYEIELNIEGVTLPRCVKCLDAHLVDDLFSALLHANHPLRLTNQPDLFKDGSYRP